MYLLHCTFNFSLNFVHTLCLLYGKKNYSRFTVLTMFCRVYVYFFHGPFCINSGNIRAPLFSVYTYIDSSVLKVRTYVNMTEERQDLSQQKESDFLPFERNIFACVLFD